MSHHDQSFAVVVMVALMTMVAGCPPPEGLEQAPSVMATGTTPNAVDVVFCADGPRLVVTASGDGRLDVIDPQDGSSEAVFLGEGSNPWGVRSFGDGDDARAVVTLSGLASLALVAPCASPLVVKDTVSDTTLFSLPTPVSLEIPFDADGDGDDDSVVTQMLPRFPQAVDATQNGDGDIRVVAAFTNILSFAFAGGGPMRAGPSTLLSASVVDDAFVDVASAVVPCDNAGGVRIDGDDVIVSCAGLFVASDVGHDKASAGGLVIADAASLDVSAAVSLDDDSLGPVVVIDGDGEKSIVVGDLLHGGVSSWSRETLARRADVAGRDGVVDSAFALITTDEHAVAGWFDGRVRRDPLHDGPIAGPPPGPIRGLVDLAVVDDVVYGLFSLSAELRRLDLNLEATP